jgi:hypothetical protein
MERLGELIGATFVVLLLGAFAWTYRGMIL